MKHILITCYPSSYRMDIGTSVHDSREDVVKELEKLCFSGSEIYEILLGETCVYDSGWVRMMEVSL